MKTPSIVRFHKISFAISKDVIWSTWWRHQMETFSALLALCAGNSPVSVNSPHKGQWRGALTFFFDLRLIKRLSKHSRGWWFETLSRPLWRHCNEQRGVKITDCKEHFDKTFLILVIIVPAGGLALLGARTIAGTVINNLGLHLHIWYLQGQFG